MRFYLQEIITYNTSQKLEKLFFSIKLNKVTEISDCEPKIQHKFLE